MLRSTSRFRCSSVGHDPAGADDGNLRSFGIYGVGPSDPVNYDTPVTYDHTMRGSTIRLVSLHTMIWSRLISIDFGETISYKNVASELRPLANAIGDLLNRLHIGAQASAPGTPGA
jgi:hypothetical protein